MPGPIDIPRPDGRSFQAPQRRSIDRRRFLRLAGAAAVGTMLAACGSDGKPIQSASAQVGLDTPPDPTSTPTPTATPDLTLANSELLEQKPLTLAELGKRVGLDFGTTVNLGDPIQNPNYLPVVSQFSTIAPIGYSIMNLEKAYQHYEPIAKQNGQKMRMYNLFWNLDAPKELMTGAGVPTKGEKPSGEYIERVKTHMDDRIRFVFEKFPNLSQLGFANEAYFEYQGKVGYEDSPYSRAFGIDWITDAYIRTYQLAREYGKTPGVDFDLFYGDYNYEMPGLKADFIEARLATLKQRAAKELGIADPPLVTDFQLHIDFSNPPSPGQMQRDAVTREGLAENMRRFGKFGKVWVGEFSIKGGDRQQRTNTVDMVINSALDSGGACNSITFWELLRPNGHYMNGDLLFDVNNNLQPTPTFENLTQMLARK